MQTVHFDDSDDSLTPPFLRFRCIAPKQPLVRTLIVCHADVLHHTLHRPSEEKRQQEEKEKPNAETSRSNESAHCLASTRHSQA